MFKIGENSNFNGSPLQYAKDYSSNKFFINLFVDVQICKHFEFKMFTNCYKFEP